MEKNATVSNYPKLLADLLSRHIGRGQATSIEMIAAEAGCSTKTIYMIRAGEFTPSFALGCRIIKCLPDEAVAEFFAALGLFGVARIEGTGSLYEAHYELARTGAAYADYLQDGLLDHREQRSLTRDFLPRVLAAAARCVRSVQR
jgi:DNA-binding XRE family transcriptional regulator